MHNVILEVAASNAGTNVCDAIHNFLYHARLRLPATIFSAPPSASGQQTHIHQALLVRRERHLHDAFLTYCSFVRLFLFRKRVGRRSPGRFFCVCFIIICNHHLALLAQRRSDSTSFSFTQLQGQGIFGFNLFPLLHITTSFLLTQP
ncbi:hypothetical protein BKA70DRAFT_187825 [Coprinopsis sp. MPI-PUGE-AT-0042]|nr:hypothetical protein BKA70DRAFT_187825 [Coprinopsis sp. MPI-PUGE-AT-0042]